MEFTFQDRYLPALIREKIASKLEDSLDLAALRLASWSWERAVASIVTRIGTSRLQSRAAYSTCLKNSTSSLRT